ncbi:MAG: glycosyltransferase family 39 protein [Nitrospiria bacterium]
MTFQLFFILVFALITLFRFYFTASLNLTPDESYYWFWSQHPDLSYFDHPPMVSYLIRISTGLFGNYAWAVRLPALFMGIGCSYLVYLLGKEVFKDKNGGLSGVVVLNSILLFSVSMVIITPDTPQLFFWLLTLYFSFHAVYGDKPRDWILAGISLGSGLLSKYTMILYLPGFILFLLMTPPFRHHLYSWKLWLAGLFAFVVFSPVLIWNYQHQWISFLFQIHHGTDARNVHGLQYFWEFLGSQAGLFSPFIFMGFFWALWKAFKIGRKKNLHQFAFLFWSVFPVFVFFLYESLYTKIEANWAGFVQSGSIILLGGFLNQKIRDRNDNSRRMIYVAVAVISFGFLLTGLVHLQTYFKLIPLSVERDRTNDLIGWEELQKIQVVFPETTNLPVLTTSHTLVGETSFYLHTLEVYQWGAPQRITDLTRAHPVPPEGSSFLLLTYDDDQFSAEAKSLFAEITPLTDIPVFYPKGIKIRTYHFYLGKNFTGIPQSGLKRE